MELIELLEEIDAPDDVTAWIREADLDFEEAWQTCRRGDHRIWICACAGVPIESLVEAAAAVVLTAADTFPDVAEPLTRAVTLAVEGASSSALIAAAEACEQLADGGVGGYRRPLPPGHGSAARAAGLVARAAEGLAAGEARREAVRLEQSRATGALIGVGNQIVLPRSDGQARLQVMAAASDPAQGAFLFSVAAAAEAVAECAHAVAQGSPRPAEAEASAREDLDAVVREALEDVLG